VVEPTGKLSLGERCHWEGGPGLLLRCEQVRPHHDLGGSRLSLNCWDQGARHALDKLNAELTRIAIGYAQSRLVDSPGKAAKVMLDAAYDCIFEKPGWSN
jgi:hypothetical protein